MNSKIPDDLVSAFHDRELTPAEEVAANLHVRQSPEAKRELESFQRMTELLGALPRQAVPPEFASSVMQRAERETLIPLDDPVAAPAAESRWGWLRRRTVLYAAGGTLAAVAGLLVAIVVSPSRDKGVSVAKNDTTKNFDLVELSERPRQHGETQIENGVAAKIAPSEKSDAFEANSDKSVLGVSRHEASKSPLSAAASPSAPAPAAPAAPGASAKIASTWEAKQEFAVKEKEKSPSTKFSFPLNLPFPAATPPAAQTAPVGQSPAAGDLPQLVFPADLKTARVGDVVEALEQSGEQVAVVRLTVVDQSKGLDGIDSLFVRDATRAAKSPRESEALRERIHALKRAGAVSVKQLPPSQGDGDLVCVFVEGTRDEVVSVLEEIQKENAIQTARLTNTISAAQLTRYSKGAVVPSGRKAGQNTPRPQQVVSLPASTVNQIVADNSLARRAARWGAQRSLNVKGAAQPILAKDSDPKTTLEYMITPGQSSAPRQFGRSQAGGSSRRSKAAANSPGDSAKPADPYSQSGQYDATNKGVAQRGEIAARRNQQQVVATRLYQAFFVLDDKKEAQPPARQPVVAPHPQAKRAF